MPEAAITPKSSIEMPPITGTGMVESRFERTLMNEIAMEITAAPPMTQTLYTRVMAITPMFSP